MKVTLKGFIIKNITRFLLHVLFGNVWHFSIYLQVGSIKAIL